MSSRAVSFVSHVSLRLCVLCCKVSQYFVAKNISSLSCCLFSRVFFLRRFVHVWQIEQLYLAGTVGLAWILYLNAAHKSAQFSLLHFHSFISAFGWCQRYFTSLRGLLIFGLKQSSAVLFAVVYCICGSVWLRTIDDCSILWFYYPHEWCINWWYQCILSHNFNFLKHSENSDSEKGIMSFSWEVDAAMLVIFSLQSSVNRVIMESGEKKVLGEMNF